jgi:hypothetical protein
VRVSRFLSMHVQKRQILSKKYVSFVPPLGGNTFILGKTLKFLAKVIEVVSH